MTADPKPSTAESDTSPIGLKTRSAALELLTQGLSDRGGFDSAMARPPYSTLEGRERTYARALASTVFRRLGLIDVALDARLKRPPPEEVRNILRLGAAQLLFRDTADFAAVSTSVELARISRHGRAFTGLVNAVLRGLARDGLPAASPEANLPSWLYARWRAAYGEAAALAIAESVTAEPPTDLSLKTGDTGAWTAGALAQALPAEILPGGSLRTARRGEISEWPGFDEGGWWVQDAGAAAAARLLAPTPGETVLDLCAAPGGKTLQLAASGARVTALDRSATRLGRLSQNLARTGLEAEVVVADAAAWDDPRQFDAVLLDAPCSATGTFRRHPEVLWLAKPADIAKLADVQTRLLATAADRVRPGGRLIYCVCSLEPEEGEAQIDAFLRKRQDFQAAKADPADIGLPAEAAVMDGRAMRVLPSQWREHGGIDGFFICRLDRTA